ncbi:MAG TPA: hypothetical protein PKL92_02720 [Aquaticitalea sp.]|nr:hypothetical protein [Aquaticitalea sp.]HNU58913.1 hypothetical protein [Aquaticitalea sp.]
MSIYEKGFEDFRQNYTLYIPLSIILQSCVGSVAAMFILMNSAKTFHFVELSLCVTFAMAYNGAIYGQMKTKWIYNLLIATMLVHIVLIVINLTRFSYQ